MQHSGRTDFDIAIVGGGAAGLATGIHAARAAEGTRVAILDGARRLGAKILVSGGGRCNVTNRQVRPADFFCTSRHSIKRVLAAFDVEATIAFFRELGVRLHEEEWGKLFPDSNTARSVLDALVTEARRLGIQILEGRRVETIGHDETGFRLTTADGAYASKRVVLATGGQSLPKTGSDGFGYQLAASLGHSIIPLTPGLVPLILADDFHTGLSGISHEAQLSLLVEGEAPVRMSGPLLWTHFGISGPVAMDISRCWHRAALEGRLARLFIQFVPGQTQERLDAWLAEAAAQRPRAHLDALLSEKLPSRVVTRLLGSMGVPAAVPLAHLSRPHRHRVAASLAGWPLTVLGSRGYNHAEVTAGGVPLTEIDPSRMASRRCPGLYLVGEILDVDGRIGGFNFQWAWSSGFVAGRAAARSVLEAAD